MESRRVAQRFYREAFADSGLHCVSPPADFLENGYLNLMVYSPADRARMEALLKEKGIGYGIVYPEPMSRQRGAQAWLKAHVGGEQALLQGQSVLSLPLFPYIRGEELEEVRDVVLAAR